MCGANLKNSLLLANQRHSREGHQMLKREPRLLRGAAGWGNQRRYGYLIDSNAIRPITLVPWPRAGAFRANPR
jgi:hypothetical protein